MSTLVHVSFSRKRIAVCATDSRLVALPLLGVGSEANIDVVAVECVDAAPSAFHGRRV